MNWRTMKRPLLLVLLSSLAAAALFLHGCDDRGELTILFTSDVKGWLTPAG